MLLRHWTDIQQRSIHVYALCGAFNQRMLMDRKTGGMGFERSREQIMLGARLTDTMEHTDEVANSRGGVGDVKDAICGTNEHNLQGGDGSIGAVNRERGP